MRVLVVTQHYHPETGATPNRMRSFVDGLAKAGHEVVVVTAKPNHPEGVVWPAYRGRGIRRERVGAAEVLYVPIYTRARKTSLTRILSYVSFMVMAVVGAQQAKGPFGVVVATSPPLFVGMAGWAISRLKRARFIFDVRDLWPALAIEMGELRGRLPIRLAEGMERFIYDHADQITAVTDSFCNEIEKTRRGTAPITRVRNGTLDIFLEDQPDDRAALQALGLEQQFVVTFAGTIGLCQGLDHVIEAAEVLQGRVPRLTFLFVGEGPVKAPLQEAVEAKGLHNVVFHPRVPLTQAAALMRASDALLVTLDRDDIYRKFIPSKLFDSMAAGRPVLLAVDGEARAVLEAAEAGLYYPAQEGQALADAAACLAGDIEAAEAMGLRGRAFARTHLRRADQAERMVRLIEALQAP